MWHYKAEKDRQLFIQLEEYNLGVNKSKTEDTISIRDRKLEKLENIGKPSRHHKRYTEKKNTCHKCLQTERNIYKSKKVALKTNSAALMRIQLPYFYTIAYYGDWQKNWIKW